MLTNSSPQPRKTASPQPVAAKNPSAPSVPARDIPRPATSSSNGQKASPAPAAAVEDVSRIAECAYYIAERRQFVGGDPVQDWLEAKRQVRQSS
jgi:hypothetical protein